jgi:phosphotransferase family enzyme
VSLHRVDPRFALSHPVAAAAVLGGMPGWREGLCAAGVEVDGRPEPDLVVCPPRLVEQALAARPRSILVEGSSGRRLAAGGYATRTLVLRPTRERPTLALALDQRSATSYALERWSVVDRRWKTLRLKAARSLAARGVFPAWASPLVTVATRESRQPALVSACRDFGVPDDASWFLAFGQGDALSRNAFQLFPHDSATPDWVLKFARVAGYSSRFDDDERGMRLAQAAGDVAARHVPRLVGRFSVGGLAASLETAATGRRLRDVLAMPGGRSEKLHVVDRTAEWILAFGRQTQAPSERLTPELSRLRRDVLPAWRHAGVATDLVDLLPPLPAVVQHNDLGTWNVVVDGNDFVVVDWENARAAALPLWDILYFLADALVQLDGPAPPEELPRRVAELFAGEASSSPALFAWVRRAVEAAATPPAAVGAIATLCWLSHSLSHTGHNVDIEQWAPDEPPRVHGIEGVADAWLAHPALGVGWSGWSA